MSTLRLDRLLEFLLSIELLMAMLWVGLAIFTVGLAILMYTRWGQYKPLRKCMAMSLLAHLLMAGYAATVEIVAPALTPAEQIFDITLGDGPEEDAKPGGAGPTFTQVESQPWEVFPKNDVVRPEKIELEPSEPDRPPEPQRLVRAESSGLPGGPNLDHVALPETNPLDPDAESAITAVKQSAPSESATPIEAPAAQRRDAPRIAMSNTLGSLDSPSPKRLADDAPFRPARVTSDGIPATLLNQIVALPGMAETNASESLDGAIGPASSMRLKPVSAKIHGGVAYNGSGGQGGVGRLASNTRVDNAPRQVPDAYRLRVAPNRAGVAQSRGGTAATETAVKAALRWLADNQSADGRWDPRIHGAGKDENILGRNRLGAGSQADTAMTGLALLAFLGSGHTHLEGPYRDDVRRGLEFLVQTQARDGNLGGQARAFEFMYCHAMATCAMSEAYGMTHDRRLRESVRRAIGYTIAAQDPKGGGWRYKPGDTGDTSQLGWQLMSLKSAELAGIPTPNSTRQGIVRYLQSVSSGKHGGLASYRPGEPSTRSMTAEALVCWQFLGLAREHPACNEAGKYLLTELPGEGVFNLYYWYYATLGMYQLEGSHWQRWNEAVRRELVDRQVKTGALAGSWDTNDLWGGHGGRVYTTALATLTLEVYYRFLPIYRGEAFIANRNK